MEASRLAPTPKPITISGSSRTRPDYSGMRSGCSGERKCRYGSSHSPDLKSGTFERAAPTAADPKEKLPSGGVEGCFGDGSRSRIGAPEAPGECSRDVRKGLSDSQRCRISKPERRIGGPANSHRCRIPRPGSPRAGYAVILQWIAWWLRPRMSCGTPSPQPPVLFSKLPFSPGSFGTFRKASPPAGPGGRRIRKASVHYFLRA